MKISTIFNPTKKLQNFLNRNFTKRESVESLFNSMDENDNDMFLDFEFDSPNKLWTENPAKYSLQSSLTVKIQDFKTFSSCVDFLTSPKFKIEDISYSSYFNAATQMILRHDQTEIVNLISKKIFQENLSKILEKTIQAKDFIEILTLLSFIAKLFKNDFHMALFNIKSANRGALIENTISLLNSGLFDIHVILLIVNCFLSLREFETVLFVLQRLDRELTPKVWKEINLDRFFKMLMYVFRKSVHFDTKILYPIFRKIFEHKNVIANFTLKLKLNIFISMLLFTKGKTEISEEMDNFLWSTIEKDLLTKIELSEEELSSILHCFTISKFEKYLSQVDHIVFDSILFHLQKSSPEFFTRILKPLFFLIMKQQSAENRLPAFEIRESQILNLLSKLFDVGNQNKTFHIKLPFENLNIMLLSEATPVVLSKLEMIIENYCKYCLSINQIPYLLQFLSEKKQLIYLEKAIKIDRDFLQNQRLAFFCMQLGLSFDSFIPRSTFSTQNWKTGITRNYLLNESFMKQLVLLFPDVWRYRYSEMLRFYNFYLENPKLTLWPESRRVILGSSCLSRYSSCHHFEMNTLFMETFSDALILGKESLKLNGSVLIGGFLTNHSQALLYWFNHTQNVMRTFKNILKKGSLPNIEKWMGRYLQIFITNCLMDVLFTKKGIELLKLILRFWKSCQPNLNIIAKICLSKNYIKFEESNVFNEEFQTLHVHDKISLYFFLKPSLPEEIRYEPEISQFYLDCENKKGLMSENSVILWLKSAETLKEIEKVLYSNKWTESMEHSFEAFYAVWMALSGVKQIQNMDKYICKFALLKLDSLEEFCRLMYMVTEFSEPKNMTNSFYHFLQQLIFTHEIKASQISNYFAESLIDLIKIHSFRVNFQIDKDTFDADNYLTLLELVFYTGVKSRSIEHYFESGIFPGGSMNLGIATKQALILLQKNNRKLEHLVCFFGKNKKLIRKQDLNIMQFNVLFLYSKSVNSELSPLIERLILKNMDVTYNSFIFGVLKFANLSFEQISVNSMQIPAWHLLEQDVVILESNNFDAENDLLVRKMIHLLKSNQFTNRFIVLNKFEFFKKDPKEWIQILKNREILIN